MICPKCGNENGIYQTLMGFFTVGKSCKDTNTATCPCGYIGEAWEFGAPDIPPMKGSEGMTDEEIEQWSKDFNEEKIKIVINPGIGIANLKGIQLTEWDKE